MGDALRIESDLEVGDSEVDVTKEVGGSENGVTEGDESYRIGASVDGGYREMPEMKSSDASRTVKLSSHDTTTKGTSRSLAVERNHRGSETRVNTVSNRGFKNIVLAEIFNVEDAAELVSTELIKIKQLGVAQVGALESEEEQKVGQKSEEGAGPEIDRAPELG